MPRKLRARDEMTSNEFAIAGSDGNVIFVREWLPAQRPGDASARKVVVIAHGAAEHGGRYERLARVLTDAGYAVYAPDHRGHGKTAGSLDKAGDAGFDGFNGIVRDLHALVKVLASNHSGKPLYLLGHSMGAALSQRFIQLYGDLLTGVVLSGSPGLRPNLEQAASGTAKLAERDAATRISTLFQQAFASYNQGFEPIKSGFEWLSRDAEEVQKYVDDPWCGFPFANRLVAQMSQCALDSAQKDNIQRIPKSLPIFMFSGTHDRVGGNGEFVDKLANLYRSAGIRDVEVKMYADGRHEMLNELNRDEVHRDLLAWLARH